MIRKYYIVLQTENKIGWRIRLTKNNLDTIDGIQEEIKMLESQENGKAVIIMYWKKLRNNFWDIFKI